ncbi:M81 family metallopeptidase [Acetobacter sp. TBRC 12305]|uniref:Microcystinase C n=1 Tax=Acetobacter garciniae TaxID=2817435 RepID=A0A939KRA5_9PROT|nr:M81 family metallopeptidase [Acetobacter garciniae]MBO1324806.1 M81 family metallopeptidase [Acetobacter garciniae]MBX0344497.1 M81 family metallopeptidase [Acetobacter garciniae]
MKLFIATLLTETNTFSPIPTGLSSFTDNPTWSRRDGSRAAPNLANIPLIRWRRQAESRGMEVVESLCAFAPPAGTTTRATYETLRGFILDDLRAAGPVDMVLLFLHGAMVAEGYEDCEGDILAHVRQIVGPGVTLGCELDLHAHFTPTMMENADILVSYKEYPHTDVDAMASEVFDLSLRVAQGQVRPCRAVFDCGLLGVWRTPVEPVRGLVQAMRTIERQAGILSVSFIHGFPWADVEHVGAQVLVITDGDAVLAQMTAQDVGERIRALESPEGAGYTRLADALALRARTPERTMVLADVSDNAGGGAPSDSTYILEHLLKAGVQNAVLGCVWDPVAVDMCFLAGVGATLPLRLGGKSGVCSHVPLDVTARVLSLSPELVQHGYSGDRTVMGRAARIAVDGVEVVLVSVRRQTYTRQAFLDMGCKLEGCLVVVKSAQHFYKDFSVLTNTILYVPVPGAASPDFAKLALSTSRRDRLGIPAGQRL